ncbi:hypothetical protein EES45_00375 [Streptomyces sp. ADI97-07]|nr:hypothetical protein EES45_00375 [Streptomyces sp. ADI97-07]
MAAAQCTYPVYARRSDDKPSRGRGAARPWFPGYVLRTCGRNTLESASSAPRARYLLSASARTVRGRPASRAPAGPGGTPGGSDRAVPAAHLRRQGAPAAALSRRRQHLARPGTTSRPPTRGVDRAPRNPRRRVEGRAVPLGDGRRRPGGRGRRTTCCASRSRWSVRVLESAQRSHAVAAPAAGGSRARLISVPPRRSTPSSRAADGPRVVGRPGPSRETRPAETVTRRNGGGARRARPEAKSRMPL